MGQIIAARLRRFGLLLGAALLVAGCSALQLGYNQAPSLVYWWVDGYADLDDRQSARLRADIDRLLAWHRQRELPAYADRLRQWQGLALRDLSGEQVCAQAEHLRTATERLMDQGHEPLAHLALTLAPAQLQHLERHQAKSNQSFEKDFLRGTPAQRLERRLDRTVDRYETLYGRLTPAQRQQVRASLEASPFDASRTLDERRTRQAELVELIRQLQGPPGPRLANDSPAPPAAAQALRAWLQRGLFASPSASGERAGWVRHGCEAFAALHNSTSPAQRQHAQRLLAKYESDLRTLAAQD
jgi:hypothetical protein